MAENGKLGARVNQKRSYPAGLLVDLLREHEAAARFLARRRAKGGHVALVVLVLVVLLVVLVVPTLRLVDLEVRVVVLAQTDRPLASKYPRDTESVPSQYACNAFSGRWVVVVVVI